MNHDINSTESKAFLAREARVRPHSVKVCEQYIRGLITQGEMIDELVNIAFEDEVVKS